MSMPANRETGKDRWRRVPKDYFRKRDRLQVAKGSLSALAVVLALGWVALGVDWKDPTSLRATDGNSLRANHGTLARVHAAWDHKCDACHVPFEPIDGRAWFASSSASPSNRSSDRLCMACHAGPDHHAASIGSEVKSCAGCHRDHQGRDASLVRLADNTCTSCHAHINDHKAQTPDRANARTFQNVSRFNPEDHPPFRPEAAARVGDELRDRTKLKFNHARHMTPGIVNRLGDTPYTVDQIPLAAERTRYQGMGKPTDPVRLDCSSCHQLDPTEIQPRLNPAIASASVLPESSGRYYRPVSFENQCRACHLLSFDPATPSLEASHGVQPDQVVAFVKQTYAAQALSDDPKLLDVYIPPVRRPGKIPVPAKASDRLDEAVVRALTFLFPVENPARTGNANNCLECHSYGSERSEGFPTRIEPTRVPAIWLTHASFNHSPHRGVSCRECHPASYPWSEDGQTSNPKASTVAADYLIPAIDNCVRCHAPAESSRGSIGGGAATNCTECHRYHDGDRAARGFRTPTRDARSEQTIDQFLRGDPPRSAPSPMAKSPEP